MKKIYLAKSNQTNPDELLAVRAKLKEYNCEIVEYTGGRFSHTPMLESDILLVLPNLKKFNDTNIIGKGLFSQIETFDDNTQKPMFVIFNIDTDDDLIEIGTVEEMEVHDCLDYIEYGSVYIDPCGPMTDTIEELLGLEVANHKPVSTSKLNKYLLIGK